MLSKSIFRHHLARARPPLGIVGDALGSAIPPNFTCIVFMPRHLKKQISFPSEPSCGEVYTLPILLTLPLVAALWLVNRFFYPAT